MTRVDSNNTRCSITLIERLVRNFGAIILNNPRIINPWMADHEESRNFNVFSCF